MSKFVTAVFAVAIVLYLLSFGWALTPLFTLFAFGTIWFYSLAGSAVIAFFIAVNFLEEIEDENFRVGGATIWFVVVFLMLQFLSDIKPLTYVQENLTVVLWYVLGYTACGVLFSIGKWKHFLKKWVSMYYELKSKYIENKKISAKAEDRLARDARVSFDGYLRSHGYAIFSKTEDGVPQAKYFKGKIIGWMCYWPLSLVWTLINDPIKKFFKMIFVYIQTLFQRIADHEFRKIKAEYSETHG